MSNIPNVIRWNANFVRGLAQSVLERARSIRGSLGPTKPSKPVKKSARKARKRHG